MKNLVFCLFEGRHKLPENQGAIYSDFDFQKMKAKSKLATLTHGHPDSKQSWLTVEDEIVNAFKKGECDLTVYVTGLTPALTQLISLVLPLADNKNVFRLMHFNRDTNSYVPQIIGKYSGKWTFDEETMKPTLLEDSFLSCGVFNSEKDVVAPFFE
jgi:hypothetical protein